MPIESCMESSAEGNNEGDGMMNDHEEGTDGAAAGGQITESRAAS